MTRLVEYNWISAGSNTAAVCSTQSGIAGVLNLNGTFVNSQYPKLINLLNVGGTSRAVSITSNANNNAVSFTVNGYQNGAFVTSNIGGPAANTTVYGNIVYDVITSITCNGNFTNISIGLGQVGFYPLIHFNYGDGHRYEQGCHMRGWALAHAVLGSLITPIIYGTVADATLSGFSYQTMMANGMYTTFFTLTELFVGTINSGNFIMTNSQRFLNQILVQGTDAGNTGTGRLDFRDT